VARLEALFLSKELSLRSRKLKNLTKKQIDVLADDEKLWQLRRTSKTKFYRDDKEIKSFEIDLESIVSVDISGTTISSFWPWLLRQRQKIKRY